MKLTVKNEKERTDVAATLILAMDSIRFNMNIYDIEQTSQMQKVREIIDSLEVSDE